mmetsp:Transcript_25394/g.72358  ORF Transcript_25394/g.72358 Transcript_25394/m.72358 type:complete len:220 (+) Transcript_25394:712-1371(+)
MHLGSNCSRSSASRMVGQPVLTSMKTRLISSSVVGPTALICPIGMVTTWFRASEPSNKTLSLGKRAPTSCNNGALEPSDQADEHACRGASTSEHGGDASERAWVASVTTDSSKPMSAASASLTNIEGGDNGESVGVAPHPLGPEDRMAKWKTMFDKMAVEAEALPDEPENTLSKSMPMTSSEVICRQSSPPEQYTPFCASSSAKMSVMFSCMSGGTLFF